MAKTLQMVFRDAAGKECTLSLVDPKADLTLAQVNEAMTEIVSRNIFTSKNGDYVQIADARILSRDTVALA
jgi:hypothetical protein